MIDDKVIRSKTKLTQTKYLSLPPIVSMWEPKGIRIYAIVSHRSIGKSTAGEQYCGEGWRNEGKKFIWMRTTDTQVERYCKTSGNRWHKYGIEIKDCIFYDIETGEICGIGVGVNVSHTWTSATFDDFYTVIYDEFIPSKTERKLKGTYAIFTNFIKTIERDRPRFRIFLLGNAWSKNNAFFIAWKYQYKEGFERIFKKGLPTSILVFCTSPYWYYVKESTDSCANELASFDPELELMMTSGKFSFDDDRCIWMEKNYTYRCSRPLFRNRQPSLRSIRT